MTKEMNKVLKLPKWNFWVIVVQENLDLELQILKSRKPLNFTLK